MVQSKRSILPQTRPSTAKTSKAYPHFDQVYYSHGRVFQFICRCGREVEVYETNLMIENIEEASPENGLTTVFVRESES